MATEKTTEATVRVARSGGFLLGLVYLVVGLAGWLVTAMVALALAAASALAVDRRGAGATGG